ncbi:MAG TPA: hypothetical protein VKS20_02480 [Candidatus Acidoferrales bacterium]|nr:hypothetical protein [Candidatus Acidoferrales bacterium]
MNSKSKFAIGVLALSILALCSAKDSCAAPPTDACSLLTPAQVSAALGVPVGAAKQEGQFDCEWDQPGWTMVRGVRLLLHILGPVGTLTPAQRFNTIKMPLPVKGIIKTPLSGVGDDAVYIIRGASAPELTVKKGNSVFQVRIQGFPRTQSNQIKAKEKTLAQDVLAKL